MGRKKLLIIIVIILLTVTLVSTIVLYFINRNATITNKNSIIVVTEHLTAWAPPGQEPMNETKNYTINPIKNEELTTTSQFGYVFTIDKVTNSFITIKSNKPFATEENSQNITFQLKTDGSEKEIDSGTVDAAAYYTFSYRNMIQ